MPDKNTNYTATRHNRIIIIIIIIIIILQDGKRPDGTTLIPWARGKSMAWDVTVPDTYAESHIDQTAREAGSAAN